VARGIRPVSLEPRSAIEMNAASFFEDFPDLSYAYRFGPPSHDTVVVNLRSADREVISRAFHFVHGVPNAREMDVGLTAELRRADGDSFALTIRTRRFAQSVHVDFDGFVSSDSYFHMSPGEERRLTLRRAPGTDVAKVPRGAIHALNSAKSETVARSSAG
jgi:beta-mannosidase